MRSCNRQRLDVFEAERFETPAAARRLCCSIRAGGSGDSAYTFRIANPNLPQQLTRPQRQQRRTLSAFLTAASTGSGHAMSCTASSVQTKSYALGFICSPRSCASKIATLLRSRVRSLAAASACFEVSKPWNVDLGYACASTCSDTPWPQPTSATIAPAASRSCRPADGARATVQSG